MALFVAKHQHSAETCPAANPEMGQMLLSHLSSQNAARNGVEIQAEAVVNDAHTLYLIVDAEDKGTVETYLQPFSQVGTVEVLAASPCESVIARGGCAAALP